MIGRGADGSETSVRPSGRSPSGRLTMAHRQSPSGPRNASGDDRFDRHARYHAALDSFVDSQVLLLRAAARLAERAGGPGAVGSVMKQLCDWSGCPASDPDSIGRAHAPWAAGVMSLLAKEVDRLGMAGAAGALRDAASLARRHTDAVKPRLATMSLKAVSQALEAGAADQRACADQLSSLASTSGVAP
jgi:hypothetical protein